MKLFTRLSQRNRDTDPASWEQLYEAVIVRKIRERYTVSQELAILRQRDSKPAEFATYNEYVESCKAAAKAELGIK